MIQYYMKNLKNYPLLTRKEEIELAKKIELGDKKAREKMILSNIRLVISIAKQYRYSTALSFEDLIQEGIIGLMTGIEKFDVSKGYKLSTYVVWWIKQSISRAIADKIRTIRRPIYATLLKNKILEEKQKLISSGVKNPSFKNIAENLDISEEKCKKILSMPVISSSLHRTIGESNRTLEETIKDVNAKSSEDNMILSSINEVMKGAIQKLDNREEKILRMRFGIDSLTEKESEKLELSKKEIDLIQKKTK